MQTSKVQFDNYKELLALALLACTIFCMYVPTLTYPFLNYDDFDYINANIKNGFTPQGVKFALTSTFGYFIPVTWFSFLTETTLFGTARPAVFRLTNLWLHIGNALIVYGIAKKLLSSYRCAFAVALLFSLHPIQVESVAWISERRGLLAAFFALLSTYSFLKFEPSPRRTLIAIGLYILSVLAKPAFVLLPIAFIGFRFAFLEPEENFQTLKSVITLEGVMLVIALGASIFQMTVPDRTIDSTRPEGAISISVGIGQLAMYVCKVLLPFQLIIPYKRYPWTSGEAMLAAGLLVCVCILAIRFGGNRKMTSAYLLWFLVLLVPTCGFVAVGKHGMANRYLYLPILSVFLFLTQLFRRFSLSQPASYIVVGALSLCLGIATRINTKYWRDTETLFRHTLQVDPQNSLARRCLFNEAIRQGDYNAAEAFTVALTPETISSRRISNVGGAYYIHLP